MIKRTMTLLLAALMMLSVLGSCGDKEKGNGKSDAASADGVEIPTVKKPTYMIYYGPVNNAAIACAMKYDIAILHPRQGNLTREQVERIQSAGTKVLGYIAVGEDLRTAGMTPEDMLTDKIFLGDGSGPRVDARAEGETSLASATAEGVTSPGGSGYASYYLDDNDHDGKPDFNPNFLCAYTNIGDPNWYDVLDTMRYDGKDGVPGIKEILTTDYGRGLGCDGLFLDTIDTCAPNSYTTDDNPARTRFEWTAVGVSSFMEKVRQNYPGKLICQNRGIFFYNHLLEHYKYSPRANVDYLFYESYMLDSNKEALYNEGFFADNKFNYAPKLAVEASRPDGFTVFSLGYAEGPEEYDLVKTLKGKSDKGAEILNRDIEEADDNAGFSHFITNGLLTTLNDYVLIHRSQEDDKPPVWSSTYNNSTVWPPHEPEPRVGIGDAEPTAGGAKVFWDVAMDKSGVTYVLYFQEMPFDFAADPSLSKAEKKILTTSINPAYEDGQYDAFPYCDELTGLESGKQYYLAIRAVDNSEKHNSETNTVYMTVTPQ